MRAKHLGSVVFGFAALVLVVASAFTPWFEWSVQNWPETQVSRTAVWGPPSYVPGAIQFGSVHVPPTDDKLVGFSACVYLAVLLLGVVSLLLGPFWALSERWGRRRAALAVAGGGWVVYIGVAVGVGFSRFIFEEVVRHAALKSTWLVTFRFQRLLVAGPLLLLAGAVIGVAGAIRAFLVRL
jgi:hypothetical protein